MKISILLCKIVSNWMIESYIKKDENYNFGNGFKRWT